MTKAVLRNRILRQYFVGFTYAISMVILGTAIGWSSPAIPKLKSENSQVPVTDSQIAWTVSMLYFGNTIGPIPTGYLMDWLGRKTTAVVLTIFPIISWLLLLFATEAYHLYISRFLCGIYFGVVYTIGPIYLAEISEPELRGVMSNFLSLMTYGGVLIAYSVGPYVDYKTLIYTSLSIPIVFVCTFIWMPESPYYLLMRNKHDAAKKSLAWLRSDKTEGSVSKEFALIESHTKRQMEQPGTYKELILVKGNRKALIIVLFLAVSQKLTGVGVLMGYSSIIIPKNSIPGLKLNELLTILGIMWFLSSIISTLLIDRLGRRALLVVSSGGCGLATMATSVWFYLHAKTTVDMEDLTWMPYIFILFHALFYSLGIGPIGSAIKGELFPANVKGKASAVNTIVLALTSFLLNKTFMTIALDYGMYMNFLVFSITSFLSVIFTIFYVIETKGKTLHDIQDELNGVNKVT